MQRKSLIIPVFNEEKMIKKVLYSVLDSCVDEIVVINDGSTDRSAQIIEEVRSLYQGKKVIKYAEFSKNRGEGAARRVGVQISEHLLVGFFDADIMNIEPEMIDKLFQPFIDPEVECVIANFQWGNGGGRITNFTIKPLLGIFCPELNQLISQPLSGMRVLKRKFLFPERIEDRNCMIGMLMDVYYAGAKIVEVDIGSIKHRHHSLKFKKESATRNARNLLKRFVEQGVIEIKTNHVGGSASHIDSRFS